MISLQKTISSIFIVPLLGIRRELLHDEGVGFVNAYLMDVGQDVSYSDAVYLLFKPAANLRFNDLLVEERGRDGAGLLDEYDYEGGYVVLVYALPELLKKELATLLNGKYSEFSEELKTAYPKVVKIKDPKSGLQRDEMALQWRIFKKDQNLKKYWEDLLDQAFDDENEVWSIPDMDRETLDIEKFTLPTT